MARNEARNNARAKNNNSNSARNNARNNNSNSARNNARNNNSK